MTCQLYHVKQMLDTVSTIDGKMLKANHFQASTLTTVWAPGRLICQFARTGMIRRQLWAQPG